MAKCVGSVEKWVPKIEEIDPDSELGLKLRENSDIAIRKQLELEFDLHFRDIACNFNEIRQSSRNRERLSVDCSEVHRLLKAKLESLNSYVCSLNNQIVSGQDKSATANERKHRLFILTSYGIIEQLRKYVQTFGRLSELDQKLYDEEQRKLLISEESITIHSLTLIWTAMISIMQSFCDFAPKAFAQDGDEQEEDYSFELYDISQMEFTTTHQNIIKAFLMDLTITSWYKFNRLVKYEDLLKSLPFLCPCHCRTYYRLFKQASMKDEHLLNDLLESVLNYERRPSMMTMSMRQFSILPQDSPFENYNQQDLAYFIVWHFYSLTKNAKDPDCCKSFGQGASHGSLLLRAIDLAFGMFKRNQELPMVAGEPTSQQVAPVILSPHQEERFRLMFHMLNCFSERQMEVAGSERKLVGEVLHKLVSFFTKNWQQFSSYLENSAVLVEDLTLFQLLAKLKVALVGRGEDSEQMDRKLEEVWDELETKLAGEQAEKTKVTAQAPIIMETTRQFE